MILKGNQRGGGSQLAAHLLNSFDNERVEIVDLRGAVARDLSGAFAEWSAEAGATRCVKFLYSLSVNPDQRQGHLTREQYLEFLDRTERSLKLVGQPRAVVFHEKRDKDGILREHCHAVWSRIDTDKMIAVQIAHDRLKLRTVAREFARDHGLELPDGMKQDRQNDRFNNRAKQENLGEKQQQERTGVPKEVRMADITACWTGAKTGSEFVHAMEDKGYYLARGDSGRYVVVDLYGEVHSLYRQIEGVKSAEIKERLTGYPLDKQPDVESAQAYAKQKLQERQQEAMGAKATEGNLLEQRKQALAERQQQRRNEVDKIRLDLYARQFKERGALREAQAADHAGVASARLEKQPKGLAAFLTRITGVGKLVTWAQGKADRLREAEHKRQTAALVGRHGRELKEMDRHDRAIARLEARESRSAANAELRESRRVLRVRTFALKPEFGQALARQEAIGAAGDEGNLKTVAGMFTRLAGAAGFTKGDLQAAFERATAGKTVRKDDTDTTGRAPGTLSRADLARQLRDDLNRMEPRRDDRDRER